MSLQALKAKFASKLIYLCKNWHQMKNNRDFYGAVSKLKLFHTDREYFVIKNNYQ